MSPTPPTPASKHAVVIGGARGIGEAVVRRFLNDGYSVTAADRLPSELATLAKEFPDLDTCVVDITKLEDLERLAAQVKLRSPHGLHAAVNTVGVFNERRGMLKTPIETFKAIVDVNLTGAFYFTRLLEPLFVANAALVHIGSVNGEMAGTDLGAYKIAKAGMHMMVRCVALEFAEDPRRIRVNCVAPGWVHSPGEIEMLHQQGWQDRLTKPITPDFIPMQRACDASEIANAVAFLCSPQSSAITGVILPVDCGVLAR